ncbi:hypothetical protein DFH09DRAFT_1317070 [Mycena vulgaris]|nr:hypothetical protein DFH09DRAFT_1317070 [Mycena vulgaris]
MWRAEQQDDEPRGIAFVSACGFTFLCVRVHWDAEQRGDPWRTSPLRPRSPVVDSFDGPLFLFFLVGGAAPAMVLRGAASKCYLVSGLGFGRNTSFFIPDQFGITGLNWRLMLASAGVPALIVCCQVLFAPEIPRWLIGRARYQEAYSELSRLRFSPVQAARDLYYIHVLLEAEKEIVTGRNWLWEMVSVPRNRNAMIPSFIVMFGQQFCGVNVIAYDSSTLFLQSGFSRVASLLSSFGAGLINFLFALPSVFTIDTFGRRNLLLFTFPFMAICLLITGFLFWSQRQKADSLVSHSESIFYSPGEGPVPFTYSAEAFPLYIRELGMSFATTTTRFFNFVLSITFPSLLAASKPQGAFGFYAAWCCVLWVLVLLFVRETKGRTLEELDQVFSLPMGTHAAYGVHQVPYGIRKLLLRQNVQAEKLYESDDDSFGGENERERRNLVRREEAEKQEGRV